MKRRTRHAARQSSRSRLGFSTSASAANLFRGLLLAAVVVVAGVYGFVFFSTPLSVSANGAPSPRGAIFLLSVTPEYFWHVWTGFGVAPLQILDRLPLLLGAAAIVLAAYAPGRVLLESVGADQALPSLETHLFSLATGLHLLSLATLLFGLAGALHAPWVFVLVYAIFLVVCRRRILRWISATRENRLPPKDSKSHFGAMERLGLTAAAPFLAGLLLAAMLPPTNFDVREYHLQTPKEWRQQGAIQFMPHNIYGNMPLGAEMHVLLAMVFAPGELGWWWGALAGKLTMALFTPLTALALYAAGRRWFSSAAGVIAALLYLTTPWIVLTSTSGLNEGVSACYWFLTFYALGLVFDRTGASDAEPTNQRGLLLLAGVLGGAAVSCKYPALLFVVAPALLGIVVHGCFDLHAAKRNTDSSSAQAANRYRKVAVSLGIFSVAAAVSCSPWLLKNAALAHNPVYPLFVSVFGGKTRTVAKDAQWKRAHAVPRDAQGNWCSAARLHNDLWRVAVGSKWQNPALAILVCLAIFPKKGRVIIRYAAGAGVFVMVAWWAATHRIDRFWLPALPLAALLAGAGTAFRIDRPWQCVVGSILAISLLFNFLIAHSGIMIDSRYFVALDALRSDTPPENAKRKELGSRVNPVHRYLNTMAPAGSKALFVGDAQPFDLEIPVLYNTCFDTCVFESLLAGRTAAQSREALRGAGVTHIYIHWGEIARYRAPGNYGFTDFVTPKRAAQLVAEKVMQKSSYQPPPGWGELYEAVR